MFAPEVPAETELVFSLVVSDGRMASAPVAQRLRVKNVNKPPLANAGPDQAADQGALIALAGTGSDPDGDPLTFSWAQRSGPAVVLDDPTSAAATFTAPAVLADTSVVLELITSDGKLSSAPATMSVLVRPVPGAPVANAGPSRLVLPGARATLDGSASLDPEGEPLSYQWTQISGSPVELSESGAVSPSFTAPKDEETLSFQLVVSDGALFSVPSTVEIAVSKDAPSTGCGCAGVGGVPLLLVSALLGLTLLRRRRAQR